MANNPRHTDSGKVDSPMGPGELNERLDKLVAEAESRDLHINHVENALEAKLEEVRDRE